MRRYTGCRHSTAKVRQKKRMHLQQDSSRRTKSLRNNATDGLDMKAEGSNGIRAEFVKINPRSSFQDSLGPKRIMGVVGEIQLLFEEK
jgi:hypothetical protein